MTDPQQHPLDDELARISDPLDRLRHLRAVLAETDEFRDLLVVRRSAEIRRARADAHPWRTIGEALGVSLQRAHELGTQPAQERKSP
jgi:hypothetical protein